MSSCLRVGRLKAMISLLNLGGRRRVRTCDPLSREGIVCDELAEMHNPDSRLRTVWSKFFCAG